MAQQELAFSSPSLCGEEYFIWYAERFGLDPQSARDLFEAARGQVVETSYPKSLGIPYTIEYMAPGQFFEQSYFGILNTLRDLGYASITKVMDATSSGMAGAAFDQAQQRRVGYEDRVTQQLYRLEQGVVTLLKLVQQLRELDIELQKYVESESDGAAGEQVEQALKGQWLNAVDGGVMNPLGIPGLAQRLSVPDLPALFYTHRRLPLGASHSDSQRIQTFNAELHERIRALSISASAQEVLAQKLALFYAWKDSNFRELNGRRRVLLQNLRNHYLIVRLQLTYVKPYLRALRNLGFAGARAERPELAGIFESSLSEIELLARKRVTPNGPYAVILLSLQFMMPLNPQSQGLLRPSSLTIQYRAYHWDDDDIARFMSYRQGEDLDLLGQTSEQVRQHLGAIEADLNAYLREAGVLPAAVRPESGSTHETIGESLASLFAPLMSVARGFRAIMGWTGLGGRNDELELAEQLAAQAARKDAFACYKAFKTAHGMLTW